MTLEAIAQYLRETAVDTDADVQSGWDIRVNDLSLRVNAASAEEFENIGEAQDAALALLEGLAGLGYSPAYRCVVGAITVDDEPGRWRGFVEVGLKELQ